VPFNAKRFWSQVSVRSDDECWPWLGPVVKRYGAYSSTVAHRVAYVLKVGPIPEGMTLDHVRERGCTSTLCCNPAHLEPVTLAENIKRAAAAQTHCINGHEYTPENTYRDRKGYKKCRTCGRAATARYIKRKKERMEIIR